MSDINKNLIKVREDIRKVAIKANRDPDLIRLVAVTKTFPVEVITEAIEAGVRAIGENRVQEAYQKYKVIGNKAEWHLIGHLQRNKAKMAVEIFDLIHSVDSLRIAEEINKCALRINKIQDILIQVNVSGEVSKFGIRSDHLKGFLKEVASLDNIRVRGLMTIAPITDDPEDTRPYFRDLRRLADDIGMEYLSMGMSGDFNVAIEEGSNIVRLGTILFGHRESYG